MHLYLLYLSLTGIFCCQNSIALHYLVHVLQNEQGAQGMFVKPCVTIINSLQHIGIILPTQHTFKHLQICFMQIL